MRQLSFVSIFKLLNRRDTDGNARRTPPHTRIILFNETREAMTDSRKRGGQMISLSKWFLRKKGCAESSLLFRLFTTAC